MTSIAYNYITENWSHSEACIGPPFLQCEYIPENQVCEEDCIRIYCPWVEQFPTLGYRIHSTSHIHCMTFNYNTATSCVFLDSTGRCRRLPDLPPSADFQHYVYPYPPGYSAVLFSDEYSITFRWASDFCKIDTSRLALRKGSEIRRGPLIAVHKEDSSARSNSWQKKVISRECQPCDPAPSEQRPKIWNRRRLESRPGLVDWHLDGATFFVTDLHQVQTAVGPFL